MSDVQRRIVTLFEARGAGQIRAALTEMRSGFGGFRRELNQSGRETSYLNNQMRALGTTMRYTLAGTTIFGTMQTVRNLGEFQAKLGEIQAIASAPGGLPLLDSQIDSLGQSLLRLSSDTATPIADLQEGIIALYSTVGDIPENDAVEMMETIASVARVSQSNIEDTTGALLGMINAFGRGTDEIPKFGDEFFKVIQLSAGMPGHVYAQQLGRLQSAATLGQFSPEEMGALAIGATRFGGSPATNMRGLAQLMRTTLDPANKNSEEVLAGIGLPRARRQELGGYGTLTEILRVARERGVHGVNAARIGGTLDELGDSATNADLGISGEGARLLADIFTRSEGRAIAAILSQLQTPGQVEGTKNRTVDQYLNEVTNSANEVDEAMERAMDYRRIQQAGTAMRNMGVEVMSAVSPLLNLSSRGIIRVEDFVRENETTTAAGIGLGAAALWRTGRRGRGILGRGLGVTAAVADSAAAMGAENRVRGDSIQNPLYVVVVYSLTGRGSGPPAPFPAPNPGGDKPGRQRGRLGRFGSFLGLGMLTSAAGATALAIPDLAEMAHNAIMGGRGREITSGHPLLQRMASRAHGTGISFDGGRSPAQQRIVSDFVKGFINEDVAERRLRRLTGAPGGNQRIRVAGRADVTVTLDQETATGRKQKKVHVPVDLFPSFTQPAPTTKGKDKTYRGGTS